MHIEVSERGRNFFKLYCKEAGLEGIFRSGFSIWGACPGGQDIKNIPQNDAEHCNGMHAIVVLLLMFFPELSIAAELAIVLHRITFFHELGEISIGDIPDDGSKNAQNDLMERDYVFNIIDECLPNEYGEATKQMYMSFQNRSDELGKLAYLIDKMDAILRGLAYEKSGCGGFYSKKKNPTEQDRRTREKTQVENLPDNWLCGLLFKIDIQEYLPYLKIFLEIFQSAVWCVRGERAKWLDQWVSAF